MSENISLIVVFGTPIFLLALGWIVGRTRERSHLRYLDRREAEFGDVLVTQVKSFPYAVPGDRPPQLIVREVVIGADYFKSFLGGLRNLFGGRIQAYEIMLVRARREATLRILDEARQEGYNAICNLRLETADVGGNAATGGRKKGMIMATILASATAYHAARPR